MAFFAKSFFSSIIYFIYFGVRYYEIRLLLTVKGKEQRINNTERVLLQNVCWQEEGECMYVSVFDNHIC